MKNITQEWKRPLYSFYFVLMIVSQSIDKLRPNRVDLPLLRKKNKHTNWAQQNENHPEVWNWIIIIITMLK